VGGVLVLLLALVIALLGLIMALGGIELIYYGGSWYYLICGAVVAAGGVFMAMGRLMGAWLYLAAWLGTWLWTLWEVGFDVWGWLPRDFGPTILAVLVVLAIPVLRRQDTIRPVARGAV